MDGGVLEQHKKHNTKAWGMRDASSRKALRVPWMSVRQKTAQVVLALVAQHTPTVCTLYTPMVCVRT